MVEALADGMSEAEIAKFQFRARNEWIDGGNNLTAINGFYDAGEEHVREKSFVLEKDEPVLLLGTTAAPTRSNTRSPDV